MKKALLAFCLVVFFVSSVCAAEAGRFGIGVESRVALTSDQILELMGPCDNIFVSYDLTQMLQLRFGFNIKSEPKSTINDDGTDSTTNLNASLLYRLWDKGIIPYVGAQIGSVNAAYNLDGDDSGRIIRNYFAIKLGLEWEVNSRVSFLIDWNLLRAYTDTYDEEVIDAETVAIGDYIHLGILLYL